MSMSDYTGVDDAAELAQRLREHEADDMSDHALDCESEDGRDSDPSAIQAFLRFWALYGLGVLVAVGSISVLAWVRAS